MKYDELIELAFKAASKAYVPYSKFRVGAIVKCKDGSLYQGCNIENCSYPAGVCGERTAIFNAYADGKRKEDIEVLVIVTLDGNKISTSCGVCRQVMSELLLPDTPVIFASKKLPGQYVETNMKELLPYSFSSEDLE